MNYRVAIVQLPLVKETSMSKPIRTPRDILELCRDLVGLAQETFHCLAVDAKNKLIDRSLVSVGIADASLVHAREVFRPALLVNSSAIVLVHNHPSGDATPSAEDIRITKQMVAAGRVLGIQVLDHVVIGSVDDYTSLREAGLVDFS